MMETPARSRALALMCLYLAAVLALGAALAPLLYKGGHWLAEIIVSFRQQQTPVIGWVGDKLGSSDFGRYFSRAFLISALGLLWPFLKWMGVTSGGLGLQPNATRGRHFLTGFATAAGLLLAMGIVFVLMGAYRWNPKADIAASLTRAVCTCLVVATLEEWLFRGVFLGLALRAAPAWLAILAISFLFSILHLVKPPDPLPPGLFDAPSWTSGFSMMGIIFRDYGDPALFVSEVSTLMAVGLILAWTRVRTGSLWLPIGLHAGWVFGVVIFGALTRTSKALKAGNWDWHVSGSAIPMIGENLKLGLVPLGVLLLTAVVLGLLLPPKGHCQNGQ